MAINANGAAGAKADGCQGKDPLCRERRRQAAPERPLQRKKSQQQQFDGGARIAKMRNDLGYFKTSPAVPTHFTGMDFKDGPSVWKAKVLKSSGMKTLPGAGGMSKGFW